MSTTLPTQFPVGGSTRRPVRWWMLTRGDVDATIIQLGFNIAFILMPVFMLVPLGISMSFCMSHLVPGYALGFAIGSFGLTWLGVNLARKENRDTVTAHVYGANAPAIVAYTLGIMMPIYLRTHDPVLAWQAGAAAVIFSGIVKLIAAPFAAAIDRLIPLPAVMTVFAAAMYTYLALVILQRTFQHPIIGILALTLVSITSLSNLKVTRWAIPPFLFIWLVPVIVGIGLGYIHPVWDGLSPTMPFVPSWGPFRGLVAAAPYLSIIVPMSIYQILQDIASVEGAKSAGDAYRPGQVIAWDGIGTLICGMAGSVVTPLIYALHPPFKSDGARIGFTFWTGVIFFAITVTGLTSSAAQLFPWEVVAALVAFVNIGVGIAAVRQVPPKYYSALLLGLVLPTGAVVSAAITSALPALHLSLTDPAVVDALNHSIYWSSLQGLSNGFLFLVLVVAAMISHVIDRRFTAAACWCVVAAAFSWIGLMHSTVIQWAAQPNYTIGWLVAAAVVYAGRWWRGDRPAAGKPVPNDRPAG